MTRTCHVRLCFLRTKHVGFAVKFQTVADTGCQRQGWVWHLNHSFTLGMTRAATLACPQLHSDKLHSLKALK